MAREEGVEEVPWEKECRLKEEGGKLVAGRVLLRDECIVERLELWGEFFADPRLDEYIEGVRGLQARAALERLLEALDEVYATPRDSIAKCLEKLLECRG